MNVHILSNNLEWNLDLLSNWSMTYSIYVLMSVWVNPVEQT